MAKQEIKCPICGKEAVKFGIRKNKLQAIQRYKCGSCKKSFTLHQTKNITYPIQTILKSISIYNLGFNLKQTQEKLESSEKIKISISTLNSWINEYKNICAYSKLRAQALKLFNPKNIIKKLELSHIQPYTFKYHKAKLYLLFHSVKYNNEYHNIAHFYEPLKKYLEKIGTDKFPHHIFTYQKESSRPVAAIANKINNTIKDNDATSVRDNAGNSASGPDAEVDKDNLINNENKLINSQQRASQIKFTHMKIKISSKNNFACKLAKLACKNI
ncbi:IS1 family transposase [Candidatus Woesearchaeota archaeon]|nr:IS1 family transposase [Candidatus Woesearchaeota archaeon]